MSTAVKSDPKLWNRIKNQILWGDKYGEPGVWNARKAQIATKVYKSQGGQYLSPKQGTSLHKWTTEKWDYISDDSDRYLPKKVRDKLTVDEIEAETRAKQSSDSTFVPYTESVLDKMRNR